MVPVGREMVLQEDSYWTVCREGLALLPSICNTSWPSLGGGLARLCRLLGRMEFCRNFRENLQIIKIDKISRIHAKFTNDPGYSIFLKILPCKRAKSGYFTHELDPLPTLMDPGGFSLDLNWTHILGPKRVQKRAGSSSLVKTPPRF